MVGDPTQLKKDFENSRRALITSKNQNSNNFGCGSLLTRRLKKKLSISI